MVTPCSTRSERGGGWEGGTAYRSHNVPRGKGKRGGTKEKYKIREIKSGFFKGAPREML